MRLSLAGKDHRHVRQAALFAGLALLGVVACQDDPLVIPHSQGPADAAGESGEAIAGGQGGEGGTLPYGYGAQAAASYGSWSGVELPPVPLAGTGSQSGSSGSGGTGGTGGPPINKNCGDSKIDPGEECDDGNKLSGDGCSSNCISRCETCEKNVCPLWVDDPTTEDFYSICYTMAGKAEFGSAAGVERKVLCHDLMDCIRLTGCAQESPPGKAEVRRCWCDLDWSDSTNTGMACNNPAKFVPGKCARQFEEASEKTVHSEIYAAFTAISVPLGPAYKLFRDCDNNVCREECLSEYFDPSPIAQITQDIVAATNDAGESPLGLLIADAQRAMTNTDFALVWIPTYNFNGYSSPGLLFNATPDRAADADGSVLASELQAIYSGYSELVYQNPNKPVSLLTMTLTGQQLYDALNKPGISTTRLQVSGLSYSWDSTLPVGQQVVEVRKDDAPIAVSESYTVTMDNILARRDFLATISNQVTVAASDPPTLLPAYLLSLPQPIEPPAPGRIVKLN